MGWRRESALDVYTGSFGFSFLCHRGFLRTPTKWRALTFGPAARRLRRYRSPQSSHFGLGGMVQSPTWALVDGIAVGTGVHAHQGDARQHWPRRNGYVRRGPWLVNYEPQYSSG
jgi:hypothetical protein